MGQGTQPGDRSCRQFGVGAAPPVEARKAREQADQESREALEHRQPGQVAVIRPTAQEVPGAPAGSCWAGEVMIQLVSIIRRFFGKQKWRTGRVCAWRRGCARWGIWVEKVSQQYNYNRYSNKEFLSIHIRRGPKAGVSKLWPMVGQVLSFT